MKTRVPTFPQAKEQLAALGLRLRLARERRGITQVLFAERIGCARETLRRLEAGDPSVAVGTFLRALRVLQLDRDIDRLAADDELIGKLAQIDALGAFTEVARRRGAA